MNERHTSKQKITNRKQYTGSTASDHSNRKKELQCCCDTTQIDEMRHRVLVVLAGL